MSPKRRTGISPKPFLRTKNIRWGFVDISSVDEMDFTEEEVRKLSLQPGDLLVCEGGDVGRTAIWKGELSPCLYQNHIHRLRAIYDTVEPVFYMYWMQAAYQVFALYAGAESRTAIPNLSGRRLKEFIAPLPPLDEQRRIMAKVEALMEQVREARRLRDEAQKDAERLMQATLAEVFPRSESPLPPDWRWVRLEEVCQVIPGQHILSDGYFDTPDGVPYITGPADFGIKYPTISKWTNSPKVFCQPGDVLLTVKGAGVGKVNCAPPDLIASIGRQVMALRPDQTYILTDFLYSSLLAHFETFQNMGRSATVPGIRKDQIKQFLIPLPSLDEQRYIAAYLNEVQQQVTKLKQAQSQTEAELLRLEQAILDKAFRGEL